MKDLSGEFQPHGGVGLQHTEPPLQQNPEQPVSTQHQFLGEHITSVLVWDVEMVAGVFELACPGQCSLGDKIVKVAGDGGSRCARDGDIILRAESAFEAVDAFTEHALEDFLLPLVELAAQAVVELCLFDNKLDAFSGVVLLPEWFRRSRRASP